MTTSSEIEVALRSSRTRTTVPSRISRTIGSLASEREFHASQSPFTLRHTRLTVSLPTSPPNSCEVLRDYCAASCPAQIVCFDFSYSSSDHTRQPGRKIQMHKIAIPQAAIDRVLKRRESLHVFGDIDPTRTAHIVVDLQNGFMAPGQPVEIAAAREIVPNVNRISAAVRAAEDSSSTSKTRS